MPDLPASRSMRGPGVMAGAFTPARPVGCRARGGMLVTFKLLDECAAEVTALARNELDPKLTPAAVKVLAASLRELILQLRTGALAFDGSRPGGRVIERHDCLYELRPRHSNGGFGCPRSADVLRRARHRATVESRLTLSDEAARSARHGTRAG